MLNKLPQLRADVGTLDLPPKCFSSTVQEGPTGRVRADPDMLV